mmetsp:Transcript_34892/g.33183  ORF Transcript_34892/g.33183 Transcript_34892/m.33183 type:complete len:457 (-) Transcript_34892:155-1525(-)
MSQKNFRPNSGGKYKNKAVSYTSTTDEAEITKSPPNNNQLQGLVTYYEIDNSKLTRELDVKQTILTANALKLDTQEALIKTLRSRVQRQEVNTKFDKIAAEGLSKKSIALSQEVDELKGERYGLIADQIYNREKVKELELLLSQGRSVRLKEMHENELNKNQIKDLESRMLTAETGDVKAQKSLLEKILLMETINSKNTAQGITINAQGEEMVSLSREICCLKEKQMDILDHSRRLDNIAGMCARERDAFEHEVRRLRKLLLSATHAGSLHGEKKKQATAAFRGARALSRPFIGGVGQGDGNGTVSNNPPPLLISSNTVNRLRLGYSSKKDSIERDAFEHEADTWAVSPSATSYRPLTYTDNKVEYSDSQSTYGCTDQFPEYDTTFTVSDKGKNSRKSKAKSAGLSSLSSSRRSLFTGSGLGLRQDVVPEFNPQGSTKQVLKKIMKDFEYETVPID